MPASTHSANAPCRANQVLLAGTAVPVLAVTAVPAACGAVMLRVNAEKM